MLANYTTYYNFVSPSETIDYVEREREREREYLLNNKCFTYVKCETFNPVYPKSFQNYTCSYNSSAFKVKNYTYSSLNQLFNYPQIICEPSQLLRPQPQLIRGQAKFFRETPQLLRGNYFELRGGLILFRGRLQNLFCPLCKSCGYPQLLCGRPQNYFQQPHCSRSQHRGSVNDHRVQFNDHRVSVKPKKSPFDPYAKLYNSKITPVNYKLASETTDINKKNQFTITGVSESKRLKFFFFLSN